MENLDMSLPTKDERIMAALSHISVILPMMGIVAPIVIWVTQKEKSKYVAFQSLQALAYQICMILAYFVGMGCYMLSFFGAFFSLSFADSSQPANSFTALGAFIPFVAFGAIFIGMLAFIIYGVVGTVQAFQGKPFRYVVIGNSVERFFTAQGKLNLH